MIVHSVFRVSGCVDAQPKFAIDKCANKCNLPDSSVVSRCRPIGL